MEETLTTHEAVQVLKQLKVPRTKQGLNKSKLVRPYFKGSNFSLWRVDHIKAYTASLFKKENKKFDSEDFDNVVKFVQDKRCANN
jgi:hypothetical protein